MDSSSQTTGGNGIMVSQFTDASPVESSSTTAGTPIDDPKQNLAQVRNSIEKTLGILHQLYLTVSSYNVASQLPLLQRMNTLVLELDNMSKLAEKCNIQVPMEVLNLIDDGKNPDEFTKDVLNGCIAKNQITKGKTDQFKALRKHLLEELEQAFPDEVETYRDTRAASAAELSVVNMLSSKPSNSIENYINSMENRIEEKLELRRLVDENSKIDLQPDEINMQAMLQKTGALMASFNGTSNSQTSPIPPADVPQLTRTPVNEPSIKLPTGHLGLLPIDTYFQLSEMEKRLYGNHFKSS